MRELIDSVSTLQCFVRMFQRQRNHFYRENIYNRNDQYKAKQKHKKKQLESDICAVNRVRASRIAVIS